MPFPAYYTPDRIGTLYVPQIDAASRAGRAAGLAPASEDPKRVFLLLVDVQVDFVHPDGALSVPGAVDDTRRMVEWIYRHAGKITKIGATLDTHTPIQIFHPPWWVNDAGEHPQAYTPITSAEVEAGVWRPLYDVAWSKEYVRKLESDAKKLLMIWPFHVMLGTPGHALVPALAEAIAYHSAARQAAPSYTIKGLIPQSEFYSAIEPEVKLPDLPDGGLNQSLLNELASYDVVYIAGQAKSHCVLESVGSLMRYDTPEQISKLRVLEDAMSSVAHPEIDFEALALETFSRWQAEGLQLTTTESDLD